jgi:flagellar protein FliS
MTPTNPRKEYVSSRVAAATPLELTRMLFEGAVQAVQEAVTAHRAGDILARGNAVTRAVEILGELRFSLRRDVAPQYCDTLSGLYGYLQRRLIQGHAEKSEAMLQEVARLIQTLLDGWIGAMHNLNALDAATEDVTSRVGQSTFQIEQPASHLEQPASHLEQPASPEPVAAAANASSPYSSKQEAEESQPRSWQF